jgi:transmembrane sensor
MKKQRTAMEEYKHPQSPDTRKAWDKLHARLVEEDLVPEQRAGGGRSMSYYIRIAAVVLVLAGIGAVVYLNVNRKHAPEMVQVTTGNDAAALIKTLADGSVIYIAQNSLFSFPAEFETGSRDVELKGEAFFDIAPNPGKPFTIKTDEALIQVVGTAFNVKTGDGSGFELFVDRGKVKVTLLRDPSHSEIVQAGEGITTANHTLVKSRHSADQATTWFRQRMQFKDETLQNIINVLNRNFNTNFVPADDVVGQRRLTVTFHDETPETMSELICMTLNLKSQTINGSVVLSENKEGAKQQ